MDGLDFSSHREIGQPVSVVSRFTPALASNQYQSVSRVRRGSCAFLRVESSGRCLCRACVLAVRSFLFFRFSSNFFEKQATPLYPNVTKGSSTFFFVLQEEGM